MTRWGAEAGDWDLVLALGLAGDALPVVSNPQAKLSKMSGIARGMLSKVPSRYNKRREAAGIAGWTDKRATAAGIRRWREESDYGICLVCRRVRAIDIDVEQSDEIIEFVKSCGLRFAVRRREGSGRALLAFICESPDPIGKQVIRLPGDGGIIELLGDSQQFVAWGTHKSGARYEWQWPDEFAPAFPAVRVDELQAAWAALAGRFGAQGAAGCDEVTELKGGARRPRGGEIDESDWITGALRERGKVTGEGRAGELYIECPWSAEHTMDSGPSQTAYFPAGGRGYETGHFKCLHAHCAGRGDAEFIEALGLLAGEFAPVAEDGEPAAAGLNGHALPSLRGVQLVRVGTGDSPIASIDNVCRALGDPDFMGGWRFAYDEFKATSLVALPGEPDWRLLGDIHYTMVQRLLERGKGFKPIAVDTLRRAVDMVAWEGRFDSAKAWLSGLSWDGRERVQRFAADYLGAEDTAYSRSVGEYLWTALAGRIAVPGLKVDMVPILIGPEGILKSSAIAAMTPLEETFCEISFDEPEDKIARKMQGRIAVEITELRALGYNKEREWIKAFITKRYEEWVPKYKERPVRYARRCVFIASTNNEEVLDSSGEERRWLPMGVAGCFPELIERDREQLWAEALVKYNAGGVAHQKAALLGGGARDKYRLTDTWEEIIGNWLHQPGEFGERPPVERDFIVMREIAEGALQMNLQNLRDSESKKVAKVLRKLGFERKVIRDGKLVFRGWKKVN